MNHDGQQDNSTGDIAERFYRVLLSLYPAEHRDSYEVPMLQLFRDIYRQEVQPGGYKTVLQFWAFILKDVVRSLFREHLTQGAKPMSIVSSLKPDVSAGVGVILLAVPSYFIGASVLRQNAPGLFISGQPHNSARCSVRRFHSKHSVDPVGQPSQRHAICAERFALAAFLESGSNRDRVSDAGRAGRLCIY